MAILSSIYYMYEYSNTGTDHVSYTLIVLVLEVK